MLSSTRISQSVGVGITVQKKETILLPNKKGRVWLFEAMSVIGATTTVTNLVSQARGLLRIHNLSAEPINSPTNLMLGEGFAGCHVACGSRVGSEFQLGGLEEPLVFECGEDIYLVGGYQLSLSLKLDAGATGDFETSLEVSVLLTEVNMTNAVQSAMLVQLQG